MYSCYICIKLVINSTKFTIVYDENLNLRHTVDSLFLDALSAPRFSPRYPCKIHGISFVLRLLKSTKMHERLRQ